MDSDTDTPEFVIVKLRREIGSEEDKHSVLRITEPTIGQILKARSDAGEKGDEMVFSVCLVSAITGVKRAYVEKIGAKDFAKVAEALAPFL